MDNKTKYNIMENIKYGSIFLTIIMGFIFYCIPSKWFALYGIFLVIASYFYAKLKHDILKEGIIPVEFEIFDISYYKDGRSFYLSYFVNKKKYVTRIDEYYLKPMLGEENVNKFKKSSKFSAYVSSEFPDIVVLDPGNIKGIYWVILIAFSVGLMFAMMCFLLCE